jgi:trehalose-6-phosphatase
MPEVEAIERKLAPCAPERKRKIYKAANRRLQDFADRNPGVRFDADTPAVILATENLDEALATLIEGACGSEAVSHAFDCYEQSLIEASGLCDCVGATTSAVE